MSRGSRAELAPNLVRFRVRDATCLALRRDGKAWDLDPHTLDGLMRGSLSEIRDMLEGAPRPSWREIDQSHLELLAPVESQEVWAAGVTYLRSREARLIETAEQRIYAHVYESARPELFFKAAGWRVVPDGGDIGIRSDSTWNVPEPELAVLANARGEIVAYACGNDMSSRSIEGENPLFLPQAKVYDRSCAIGPAAILSWAVDISSAAIHMTITRDGGEVFAGAASVAEMTRDPADLIAV